jgi:hypothetical protein
MNKFTGIRIRWEYRDSDKLAVHTPTQEEFDEVSAYDPHPTHKLKPDMWDVYREDTCVNLHSYSSYSFTYGQKDWEIQNRFEVISMAEWRSMKGAPWFKVILDRCQICNEEMPNHTKNCMYYDYARIRGKHD